jgi:membrane dipeptidase
VGSYAEEILRMADLVGPQAVAFGTDMDGAGRDPVMSRYEQVREVVDLLARRGLPGNTLHNLCIGNYARVLKKAMTA